MSFVDHHCFDSIALQAAREVGHPEWGYGGPHDAGSYNSLPDETGFFCRGGSWDSEYGRFFLEW